MTDYHQLAKFATSGLGNTWRLVGGNPEETEFVEGGLSVGYNATLQSSQGN